MYGLNKLYLLMEKQHNRGQDGAGAVCVKFDMHPGKQYINRVRSNHATPIKDVFQQIRANYEKYEDLNPELLKDPVFAKENLPFAGELYLGHLRYGTFGKNNIDYVHPVMRVNNWRSRNLVMAGNFNLTNVDELFQGLIDYGQHPKDFSDTVTILEMVGLFLDEENQRLFRNFKNNGVQNKDISQLISSEINIAKIIQESSKNWDGGYAVAGLIGHGDAFVARDPWGIRPASWYANNEMIVVASERAVIQTVMNVPAENVKELQPGSALVIKKDGTYEEKMIRVPQERKSCSFERIYFSRGSDQDIYRERKKLGENLVPSILKAIDYDFDNSVFSYIPNTAESAFYGMIKGLDLYVSERKKEQIRQKNGKMTDKELVEILHFSPRVEKIAIKDAKLRTFITEDAARDDMVAHVYDVTYGTVRKGTDNLVVIDDSIVRGTTLKQSILKILDRLGPKKIVIVSSAPQIRYPDCYGIDMAKLGDFIAFEAAIHLLKETGQQKILAEVYKKCKAQENLPKEDIVNYVKGIYKPFTAEQISKKIADLLTPDDIKAEVNIVFQSIEDLHAACPNDLGDWYFTGDYPTPGGNKVVNTAFINYIEGKNQRAY